MYIGYWTLNKYYYLLLLDDDDDDDNSTDPAPSSSCSPTVDELLTGKRLVPPSSPTVDELAHTSWKSLDEVY